MIEALLADLDVARSAFLDALNDVDEELVTVAGVVDGWSVRDLVVHIAFWVRHGIETLELARSGRGAEYTYDPSQLDATNARVVADAASVTPSAALEREAAEFAAFREAIASIDPARLAQPLGNGYPLESVVRYDGPEHYAEHTAQLRVWFGPDPDDD